MTARAPRPTVAAVIVAALAAPAAVAQTAEPERPIEISESVALPGAPAEVWAEVGGFCAIADWHPAVASCDEADRDGTTVRTLALEGGGALVEERVDEGEALYAYVILDGPLPVADYRSEIAAEQGQDGGTTLTWSGAFAASGATPEEAEAVIRGIYRAGLDALAAR